MNKLNLAEMTQTEVRSLIARRPLVLVPLGSLEDQGPHTFMGDHLCAGRIAELIAERSTSEGLETVVAPTFPFGCEDFFGSSPGGIALSSDTFRRVLNELFEALLRHGLNRIIVINGHGGNVQPLHEVGSVVRRTHGVLIPSLYIWKIAHFLQVELLGRDEATASAGHGANPLGSVAMHLFPQLVRPDLIPPRAELASVLGLPGSNLGSVRFDGIEIDVPVDYDVIAPGGVVGGDPRGISAELGSATTERLVGVATKFLRHYADQQADAVLNERAPAAS